MAEKMNAAPTPPPAVEGSKKSSCWKIGIIVLAVLGALFIIFIILVLLLTKGVGDVADKEMKALKANDYAGAYALTSSEFQASTSLDQFKSFMAQYPALVSNKSYSFSEKSTDNNMGDVKGMVIGLDGKNYNLELQMIKEGSDWKVLNFHLTSAGSTSATPQTPAANPQTNQAPTTSVNKINAIMVSDVLDSRGVVVTNKEVISANTGDINATVYVNVTKPDQLGAALVKVDTNEMIATVKRDMTTTGDRIFNFIFPNKNPTWTPGQYMIYSETPTGDTGQTVFTIQ